MARLAKNLETKIKENKLKFCRRWKFFEIFMQIVKILAIYFEIAIIYKHFMLIIKTKDNSKLKF